MNRQAISTILLPVDGSEGSLAALRLAVTMAEALKADIEVLFAFPRDALEMFGPPMGEAVTDEMRYMDPAEFEKLREQRTQEVFSKVRNALDGESGLTVREVVLKGDAAQAILDHAAQAKDPLIVVGSRGLSRFKEMILGSVSQKLLHHAKCPVTIAHA